MPIFRPSRTYFARAWGIFRRPNCRGQDALCWPRFSFMVMNGATRQRSTRPIFALDAVALVKGLTTKPPKPKNHGPIIESGPPIRTLQMD